MKSLLMKLFQSNKKDIKENSFWIYRSTGKTYGITRTNRDLVWVQKVDSFIETCWTGDDFLEYFYKEK